MTPTTDFRATAYKLWSRMKYPSVYPQDTHKSAAPCGKIQSGPRPNFGAVAICISLW